jgi:hypothetical protein
MDETWIEMEVWAMGTMVPTSFLLCQVYTQYSFNNAIKMAQCLYYVVRGG